MSTELETTTDSPLTPKMRMGAWADAQGLPVKEIAEIAQVHEKTISHWRRNGNYLGERERWQTATTEKLDNVLAAVKASFATAAQTTVDTLVKALEAVDAEGEPRWSVRIEAAKVLSQHPAMRLIFAIPNDGGPAINPMLQLTSVQLHVHDGKVTVTQEGEEYVVEDGDFTEVEET